MIDRTIWYTVRSAAQALMMSERRIQELCSSEVIEAVKHPKTGAWEIHGSCLHGGRYYPQSSEIKRDKEVHS